MAKRNKINYCEETQYYKGIPLRLIPSMNLDWAMQKAYRQNKFRYARIAINPYTWKEVIVGER